jgi:uncharacterized integral membrane protein (TIGR00698 family)
MTAIALGSMQRLLGGRLPGLAAAAGLALAAGWIAAGLGDPLARNPVLVAMLLGLAIGLTFGCPQALRPGLDFTKRTLLRLGIVLLGFRITGALLVDLGPVPIAIAATELVVVLLAVRWLARRVFGLDADLALLVAAGSAICGAAAILSFASMRKERERFAGPAVTLITLAGTVALLAYPLMYARNWLPGLDEQSFGITVGASIFELAQVYGASASVSDDALNVATLVKLTKVLMLIPLLLVAGWGGAHQGEPGQRRRVPIPWFIVGFLGVLAANSMVTFHPQWRAAMLGSSQFLLMMTTAALGLTTSLAALRAAGGGTRLLLTGVFALALSASAAYVLTRTLATAPSASASVSSSTAHDGNTAWVTAGAKAFDDVGCGKCHVPFLHGTAGQVRIYSDLLLHDMGPGLDDKIVQGDAGGADWRTTPLVGLGTHERYLHDGRAETLRDAILAHGGEAEIVRQRFFDLDEAEQREVLAFLRSL